MNLTPERRLINSLEDQLNDWENRVLKAATQDERQNTTGAVEVFQRIVANREKLRLENQMLKSKINLLTMDLDNDV